MPFRVVMAQSLMRVHRVLDVGRSPLLVSEPSSPRLQFNPLGMITLESGALVSPADHLRFLRASIVSTLLHKSFPPRPLFHATTANPRPKQGWRPRNLRHTRVALPCTRRYSYVKSLVERSEIDFNWQD